MTGQDIGFDGPIVAKEGVGSLLVRPVRTRPRRGRPYSGRQLLEELSQSLAVANILEVASHNFMVNPFIRPQIRRRFAAFHALTLSPSPHRNHFAEHLKAVLQLL
jgi:hypothetical protein